MKEPERIADQLRRAHDGEAWHGPALVELLHDVSASEAVARPIFDAHSIWEIVLHVTTWERVARKRAAGRMLEDPPPDLDWPPAPEESGASEDAWVSARQNLEREGLRLRRTIESMDDSRLGRTIEGLGYSVYHLLHGVVQHDLYHAGQIALLKKALRAGFSRAAGAGA